MAEPPQDSCNCTDLNGLAQAPNGNKVQGAVTQGQSQIDNQTFSHFHYGVDYEVITPEHACATCAVTPSDGFYDRPLLHLRRVHRPRDQDLIGSFGPGIFLEYDLRGFLYQGATSTADRIEVFDPRNRFSLDLQHQGSGRYTHGSHGLIKEAQLYSDAAMTTTTASIASAVRLKVSGFDGATWAFEVFSPLGAEATYREARPLTQKDANGHGITWTYQHPITATAAQLGHDARALWTVDSLSDGYGNRAYLSSTRVANLPLVSRIIAPNQTVIAYSYGDANAGGLVGLSRIAYPDGSVSRFEGSVETATNLLRLRYRDAGAKGSHGNKTLYLTQAVSHVSSNSAPQPSGRVRKVVNADGELSYLNWIEPHATDTTKKLLYVVDAGGALTRTTLTNDQPSKVERALTWSIDQATSTYTWETVQDYTIGAQTRIGETKAADGRSTSLTRDAATGMVLGRTVKNPGGTVLATEAFTFNANRKPTRTVDAENRAETWAYDAAKPWLCTGHTVGLKWTGSATQTQTETATRNWTYTTAGQVATAKDGTGAITNYFYDSRGFLNRVQSPADVTNGARAEQRFQCDAYGRLERSTDAEGRVTRYAWDSRNRLSVITYHDGSQETFSYTVAGQTGSLPQVTQHVDRSGGVHRFTYDASTRRVGATTETALTGGQVLSRSSWTYRPGTELVATSTVDGTTSDLTYDVRGRPSSSVRRPRSDKALTSSIAYDNQGRPWLATDPYGRRVFTLYDELDRVVRILSEIHPGAAGTTPTATSIAALTRLAVADPGYAIVDVSYDKSGKVTRRIDERGTASTYVYDWQGREKERIAGSGVLAAGSNTTITAVTDRTKALKTVTRYDQESRPVGIDHPRHFDTAENPPATPAPFTTTYAYTPRGLLKQVVEAAGRTETGTTNLTYTLLGLLEKRTDPLSKEWVSAYHACCARLQAQTMPNTDYGDTLGAARHATIYGYDHEGRLTVRSVVRKATGPTICGCTTTLVTTDIAAQDSIRRDALGRPVTATTWLQAQASIDPYAPPLPSGPSQGLNTGYVYDVNLTDGQGLDVTYVFTGLGFGAGSRGSAVEVTRADGKKEVVATDGVGRVVRSIDAQGGVTTFTYDAAVTVSGKALIEETVTDAENRVTRARRNGQGLVVSSVDAAGKVASAGYDAGGLLVRWRDPTSRGGDRTYDALGRVLTETDTASQTTTWTYSAAGALPASVTDPAGHRTSFVYDPRGRLKTTTLPNGNVITATYDAAGQLLSRSDSLGALGSWTWYDNGRLKERKDALAKIWRYRYTPLGQVKEVVDPLNFTVKTAYDLRGLATSVTDARTNTTSYEYDALGRLKVVRDAENRTTTSTWSDNSWLLELVDAAGDRARKHEYDKTGRMKKSWDARDNLTQYDYTAQGWLKTVTRADSQTITRTYDDAGRLLTLVAPAAGTSTWTYDTAGRTATFRDARAYTTTYGYDPRGLLTSEKDAANKTSTWTWDSLGRLATATRKDGVAITQTHDLRGRPDLTTVPGITMHGASVGARSIDRDWDLRDLPTLTRWNGTTDQIAYTYDDRGLRTGQSQTVAGSARALGFTYDGNGNRLTRVDPNGTTTYVLDPKRDLVTTLQDPRLGDFTFTYDGVGRVLTRTAATSGVVSTWTWDDAGNLDDLRHEKAGTVLARHDYLLNALNLRQSETLANGNARSFTYDNALRLDLSSGSGVWGSEDPAYDLVGNWTHGSTSHDSRNRLTADAGWTYTYTDEGELLQQTSKANVGTWRKFSYSAEGLLLQVQSSVAGTAQPTVSYGYDGDGRRVTRTVATAATDRFVYDGDDPLLEYQGANLTAAMSFAGLDTPLGRWLPGTTPTKHYCLADGLGSITALTNATGTITERYSYTAYGQPSVRDAAYAAKPAGTAALTPYGYTGREWDHAAGLLYLRNRYYDPVNGRFTRVDPIRSGVNWYGYGDQSPTNRTDPFGLESAPCGPTGPLTGGETPEEKLLRIYTRLYGAERAAEMVAERIQRDSPANQRAEHEAAVANALAHNAAAAAHNARIAPILAAQAQADAESAAAAERAFGVNNGARNLGLVYLMDLGRPQEHQVGYRMEQLERQRVIANGGDPDSHVAQSYEGFTTFMGTAAGAWSPSSAASTSRVAGSTLLNNLDSLDDVGRAADGALDLRSAANAADNVAGCGGSGDDAAQAALQGLDNHAGHFDELMGLGDPGRNQRIIDSGILRGMDSGTPTRRVDELRPLTDSAHAAPRPHMQRMSDQELLDAVNNPTNRDRLLERTTDGQLLDGNGRAHELQRRMNDPASSIRPDTRVPVEEHTPDNSMFWDADN